MSANDDVTLNINFVFSGSKSVNKNDADSALGVAVSNVGFKAAKNRQRKLKANLHRDFAPIVERELQQMARDVARMGVGLANPNNPPPGRLSISGKISSYMAGRSAPMNIASMTGTWATRTKAYMRRKVKKYKTRRWFKNTGRLQSQLKSLGTYRSAYGPVSVKFTPRQVQGGSSGARVVGLGRSPGGQSRNIQIGRLEIKPFRRLSLGDLPDIGQKADYNRSLLSPLADSIERKLTGQPKTGKYRPVLEPFMSYYLSRKIPNAVFLKLEQSLA